MKPEEIDLITTNDFGKPFEEVTNDELIDRIDKTKQGKVIFSYKFMNEMVMRKLLPTNIKEYFKKDLAMKLLNEFFELVTDLDDDQLVPDDNIAHFWLINKSSPTVMSTEILNVKQFEILRSILNVRKVNNMYLK